MKRLIVACWGILLWGNGYAFFSWDTSTQSFESLFFRTERRVQIYAGEGITRTEIRDQLHNTTDQPQELRFVFPLPEKAENISFFVQSGGHPFGILKEEEARAFLFEKAALHRDHRFFSLGQWSRIFISDSIMFSPGEKKSLKLTFESTPQVIDDFQYQQIFLADGIKSEAWELAFSLSHDEPLTGFLASLQDEALVEKGSDQTAFLIKKAFFSPDQHFSFFWSTKDRPVLEYDLREHVYRGFFQPREEKKNPQKILFLVDRTGSMLGEKWDRVQEWLSFLLELWDGKEVSFAFLGEGWEEYEDGFSDNDFAFRRDFSQALERMKPVGDGTFTKGISIPSDFSEGTVVLFTDQDFWIDPEVLPASVIAFSFSPENKNLHLFAKLSGGFFQKLFQSATGLPEKEDFLDRWENWREKISFSDGSKNFSEVLPTEYQAGVRKWPVFFTGRKTVPFWADQKKEAAFLSRVWGARKIAEILKLFVLDFYPEDRNPHFPESESQIEFIDALLALGRSFGIQTSFFDQSTQRSELEAKLSSISHFSDQNLEFDLKKRNIEREILRLQDPELFSPQTNARFSGGVPLYPISLDSYPQDTNPESILWQQFDYPDRVDPDTLIEIAPFSEAQKELFVRFPEFVAEAFGVSSQVEFCTAFRCLSVREGQRSEPIPSDRAFFRDFDPSHWAAGYAIQAVKKDLLEPELNGKLHLDRAIDRGDFVKMVVQLDSYPSRDTNPKESGFQDVPETSEFYNAVMALVGQGIIKGYEDGTFRPLQNLTRAEGVKILLAADGFEPVSDEPVLDSYPQDTNPEKSPSTSPFFKGGGFTDVHGWERPWVGEAARRGIVKGYEDGTFRPHAPLTRAEAVKLVLEMK
ncbi:S-layer homology domain-containing protein [Candidatus Gracilibacteria bacterium]|nr:S-layer homology domain-containing protein [Candidatus Gracilibacteria bacterium]MCF7818975.1 S-layer homology domain-containing protein [Candidatus Gracilibacteria bacterium]